VCRGAGTSKGRTSWQSKAEQDDYISFLGFLLFYLHHLRPPSIPKQFEQSNFNHSDPELHDLSPIPSQSVPAFKFPTPTSGPQNPNTQPLLLLSGYSYGALITTLLPPIISSVIVPFQAPIRGSPHAEIRMRASFLADQQNELMKERFSSLLLRSPLSGRSTQIRDRPLANPKIRQPDGGVRIGGEEDLRRSSHETHGSRSSFTLDSPVRKSVERVSSIAKSGRLASRGKGSHESVASSHRMKGSVPEISPEHDSADDRETIKAIPDIAEGLQIAYLLVSPLQGWVNTLATLSLWGSKPARATKRANGGEIMIPEHDMKLTIDPTLALFGDDDIFVSVNKLRAWAERLHDDCEGRGQGQFRHKEVPRAGHFWHDREAVKVLREEVRLFVSSL
jgi:hypothetical protein